MIANDGIESSVGGTRVEFWHKTSLHPVVIITWVHYQLGTLLNSTRDEKVENNRIEEILVSNSRLVSGLSEASGLKFSLVEISQKNPGGKNW